MTVTLLWVGVPYLLQAWLLAPTLRNLGGTSIGILFGMQALGGVIGPSLGRIIGDKFGLIATFYFLGGMIILANLLIIITPFDERKAVQQPSRHARRQVGGFRLVGLLHV